MKKKHKYAHGVSCEKCGTHCSKEEYIAIMHRKPIIEDTTGGSKIINSFNLCNSCYNSYMNFIKEFCYDK